MNEKNKLKLLVTLFGKKVYVEDANDEDFKIISNWLKKRCEVKRKTSKELKEEVEIGLGIR